MLLAVKGTCTGQLPSKTSYRGRGQLAFVGVEWGAQGGMKLCLHVSCRLCVRLLAKDGALSGECIGVSAGDAGQKRCCGSRQKNAMSCHSLERLSGRGTRLPLTKPMFYTMPPKEADEGHRQDIAAQPMAGGCARGEPFERAHHAFCAYLVFAALRPYTPDLGPIFLGALL